MLVMKKLSFLLKLSLIVAFSLLVSGCQKSPQSTKYSPSEWNVLWISIDDVKTDHLGSYGYHRKITPAIDQLAETGIRFERCITQSTWTLPSYASMLTSRYPYEIVTSHHYLRHISDQKANKEILPKSRTLLPFNTNWYTPLRKDVATLAQVLSGNGLTTAAWTNNQWLSPAISGLNRGFDKYVYTDQPDRAYRDANQTMQNVKKWVQNQKLNRWFVFVHLMDPHSPWRAHPEFRLGDRDIDKYDAELAFTDRVLGVFFKWMSEVNLFNRTMVIINSDHGEGIYEDPSKFFGHGGGVREDLIHVPLIIILPGGPKGKIVKEQVRNIDVFPTILEYLGIQPPAGIQGLSLRGHIQGKPVSSFPLTALTMAMLVGPEQIALTTKTHWIFYLPNINKGYSYKFTDHGIKAAEKDQTAENLIAELKVTVDKMKNDLKSIPSGEPIIIEGDALEKLKALGYF
jgi:arylsulfatase A-like enzyme